MGKCRIPGALLTQVCQNPQGPSLIQPRLGLSLPILIFGQIDGNSAPIISISDPVDEGTYDPSKQESDSDVDGPIDGTVGPVDRGVNGLVNDRAGVWMGV